MLTSFKASNSEVATMKTYHKSFCGVTASITDMRDGRARLIARLPNGKKIKDSIHKNRIAARSAWYRMA